MKISEILRIDMSAPRLGALCGARWGKYGFQEIRQLRPPRVTLWGGAIHRKRGYGGFHPHHQIRKRSV